MHLQEVHADDFGLPMLVYRSHSKLQASRKHLATLSLRMFRPLSISVAMLTGVTRIVRWLLPLVAVARAVAQMTASGCSLRGFVC